MRIAAWHYGKLIILWAWTALLVCLIFYGGVDVLANGSTGKKLTILLAMGILPVGMSIVTWKWLTGRQGGG